MIYWKDLLEFLQKFENGIQIDKLIRICKMEKHWESNDISSCLRFLGKIGRIKVEDFRIKIIPSEFTSPSPELSQR